jgi:DNA polymerase-3 subunit delta'
MSAERPPVLASIVGQESAVALLARAVATDRLAHAYAFVGPPGVGRRTTAVALAQAVLCPERGCGACSVCRRVLAGQHADARLIAPTPPRDNPKGVPLIRIEHVRELERTAALAPHEGPRKVFILDDADRLTRETPQALLKTLEEPPPRTLLVLVISQPRALPPTVMSRCQRVRFRPLPAAIVEALLEARGVPADDRALLARLSRGQVGLALAAPLEDLRGRRDAAVALLGLDVARLTARLGDARPDRATVAGFLDVYRTWYRDALCLAVGGDAALLVHGDREADLRALAGARPPMALVAALEALRAAAEGLDANVAPRLVLEHALLSMAAPGRQAA